MKFAIGSLTGNVPAIVDGGDIAVMQNFNAAGTVNTDSTSIDCGHNRTVAICKWIDASNYGVNLGGSANTIQAGQIAEIYADGGDITVYPDKNLAVIIAPAPFFNGNFSVVVPAGTGKRFMAVRTSLGVSWAFLD